MTKKMSRLNQLNRTAGNIEPDKSYDKDGSQNLKEIEKNLKEREKLREKELKINNQKYSLKYGLNVKKKLEAQKQIEDIKYDYELIELLLDRNSDNYSQKDKAKYNILID